MNKYVLRICCLGCILLIGMSASAQKRKQKQKQKQKAPVQQSVIIPKREISENEAFKIKQLSADQYLIMPTDTLTLGAVSLRAFEGKVGNKRAQLIVDHSLMISSAENFSLTFSLYTGNNPRRFLYGGKYTTGEQKDAIIFCDIMETVDNGPDIPRYRAKYDPANDFVELREYSDSTKVSENKVILKESPIKFSTHDKLNYYTSYCIEDDNFRNNSNYENTSVPENYPANYSKLFTAIDTVDYSSWKRVVSLDIPKGNREDTDNEACFEQTSVKKTTPLYWDNAIYETQTYEYSYSGGAHGVYGNFYKVYDVKQGKRVELKDLLNSDSEYLKLLYKQEMREKYGDMLFEEDMAKITISPNFYLLPDGITFVHSIYEIAPYVLGEPTLFVPFSKLKPYMKKEMKDLVKRMAKYKLK